MSNEGHTIQEELRGVLLFVGAIWGVYLLKLLWPGLETYGLVPRRLIGLVGIPTMPFLHGSLTHILGNTIPLFVLLILLAGSRARSWEVVIDIVLLGGLLLWLFGRPAVHVGASGLISGLTAFLILSGFLEQRIVPLLIAVIVGFLYGGSLILGVVPRFHSNVSWDGHLCGAIAGGVVAYVLARDSRRRPESSSTLEVSSPRP
ncbi:MAG: rhomboid family intramembrane serine protease [Isosphaeraceae bacterium]